MIYCIKSSIPHRITHDASQTHSIKSKLKMASKRPRKRAKKDGKLLLQEALQDCNKLLELSKKPRKKVRFRISRNPLTGRRNTHCPYKPRFRDENSPGPSTSDSRIDDEAEDNDPNGTLSSIFVCVFLLSKSRVKMKKKTTRF